MAPGPLTSWQIDGETLETVTDFVFWGSKFTVDGDWRHEIKRSLVLGRTVLTNLDSILKSRDITLPTTVCLVKAIVFPVVMNECESWSIKKAEHRSMMFWTVVLEKTPQSTLDSKENQAIHPKGNQSWLFIGRTDTETAISILWPHDAKNWLVWKDPDPGKDWRCDENVTTEDGMVRWHHWLNEHSFE